MDEQCAYSAGHFACLVLKVSGNATNAGLAEFLSAASLCRRCQQENMKGQPRQHPTPTTFFAAIYIDIDS